MCCVVGAPPKSSYITSMPLLVLVLIFQLFYTKKELSHFLLDLLFFPLFATPKLDDIKWSKERYNSRQQQNWHSSRSNIQCIVSSMVNKRQQTFCGSVQKPLNTSSLSLFFCTSLSFFLFWKNFLVTVYDPLRKFSSSVVPKLCV